MRPIYTLHGGEFLLGEKILEQFRGKYEIWIPTKDNGVDLLLTHKRGLRKPVTIQVKSSRSYGDEPWGWFSLKTAKIRTSNADLWVFVIPFYTKSMKLEPQFVLLPLSELKRRVPRSSGDTWHLYLYITRKKRCFDARGWTNCDYERADQGEFDRRRDYSKFLENWSVLR